MSLCQQSKQNVTLPASCSLNDKCFVWFEVVCSLNAHFSHLNKHDVFMAVSGLMHVLQ